MNNNVSQISNNLFSSIELIAENQLSKATFDKTFLCVITAVDEKQYDNYYKYTVKYEEGNRSFIIYSLDKYSVNQSVWVKVPNGDWNNTNGLSIQGTVKSDDDFKENPYSYDNGFIKTFITALGQPGQPTVPLSSELTYITGIITLDTAMTDTEEDINDFIYEYVGLNLYIKNNWHFNIIMLIGYQVDINEEKWEEDKYYLKNNNIFVKDDYEYYDEDTEYYKLYQFKFSDLDLLGNPYQNLLFPFGMLFKTEEDLKNKKIKIQLFGNKESDVIENNTEENNTEIDLSNSVVTIGRLEGEEE